MMRVALLALAVALATICFAAPSQADETAGSVEPGIYRFGATYRVLNGGDADFCQTICTQDNRCIAWSHMEGLTEDGAYCELKRGGGRVELHPLATSGISPRHEAIYATMIETPDTDGLLGSDSSDSDEAPATRGPDPLQGDALPDDQAAL